MCASPDPPRTNPWFVSFLVTGQQVPTPEPAAKPNEQNPLPSPTPTQTNPHRALPPQKVPRRLLLFGLSEFLQHLLLLLAQTLALSGLGKAACEFWKRNELGEWCELNSSMSLQRELAKVAIISMETTSPLINLWFGEIQ